MTAVGARQHVVRADRASHPAGPDDLGGCLWLPGPPIGVADEPRVPAVGQCLQCGGATALGLDDQPLLQDFVWTA